MFPEISVYIYLLSTLYSLQRHRRSAADARLVMEEPGDIASDAAGPVTRINFLNKPDLVSSDMSLLDTSEFVHCLAPVTEWGGQGCRQNSSQQCSQQF